MISALRHFSILQLHPEPPSSKLTPLQSLKHTSTSFKEVPGPCVVNATSVLQGWTGSAPRQAACVQQCQSPLAVLLPGSQVLSSQLPPANPQQGDPRLHSLCGLFAHRPRHICSPFCPLNEGLGSGVMPWPLLHKFPANGHSSGGAKSFSSGMGRERWGIPHCAGCSRPS